MWDLIVSVPDHCLSFYSVLRGTLQSQNKKQKKKRTFVSMMSQTSDAI